MKKMGSEFRITGIYLLVGILWILLSDLFLSGKQFDSETLTFLQSIKGTIYVLATGALLFYLVKSDRQKKEKINQDLKEAMKKAEESDRLKSAFLSNLSHEVRTPMNGIMGFAELLGGSDVTEEETIRYIEQITKNSHQLLGIIHNIVDISKLETGQYTLQAEPVRINHVLDSLAEEFENTVPLQSPVSLKKVPFDAVREAPELITDEGKLTHILKNFISNALKFTPAGTIHFGCRLLQNNNYQFFVQDTGIGIPHQDQEVIFERFRQLDHQKQVVKSGSGLGLAIAKAYSQILKGQIRLESTVGQGSVFYLELPPSIRSTDES